MEAGHSSRYSEEGTKKEMRRKGRTERRGQKGGGRGQEEMGDSW
jgi:hypothetical protein